MNWHRGNRRENIHLLLLVCTAVLLAVGLFFYDRTPFLRISERPNLETIDVPKEHNYWSARIDEVGAKFAYEEFKLQYQNSSPRIQHDIDHLFGELLYEKVGLNAMVICDSSFFFGCYHSLFIQAVSTQGMDVIEDLNRVCEDSYGLLVGTACQYGIGHGLLEYMGRDRLVDALNACTRIMEKPYLYGCTGGVFMEYTIPFVITLTSAAAEPMPFSQENPYAPCTAVPEEFQYSCYHELAEWWEQVFDFDIDKMAHICDGVEDQSYRSACFRGIGTHSIAELTGNKIEESNKMCEEMPLLEDRKACAEGSAVMIEIAEILKKD